MEKNGIEGKNIVITGAGGFLGSRYSEILVERGANLLLLDINEKSLEILKKNLIQKYGSTNSVFAVCNITNQAEVNLTVSLFEKNFGSLNGLVNNACVNPSVEAGNISTANRFENYGLDGWEREIGVGLTGTLVVTQAVTNSMLSNKHGGSIVNIGSHYSVNAPNQEIYQHPNIARKEQPVKPISYSVVKHGLIGMTKYLAAYFAEDGIRVNCLSPGGIFNDQPQEFVENYSKLVPMKRMGELEETVGALVFLLSDESTYVTGINLLVDGGKTIW